MSVNGDGNISDGSHYEWEIVGYGDRFPGSDDDEWNEIRSSELSDAEIAGLEAELRDNAGNPEFQFVVEYEWDDGHKSYVTLIGGYEPDDLEYVVELEAEDYG